ncbi:hypothetical protein OC846_001750 [Tilletia horrida]|uniref:DUF6818 domain-containing protein n=1 Tax=Tilletia horrida TaxID=155126 RepID=A0AAN6JZK9_9BASI|nr:hypothetical protein OC845_004049 [Tilletia horrida]KAK0555322.1 hypothetical protein OC846_001750 [Tilletia horrida]KAK0568528.1 hypothetical protein OC861_001858 [Tilletia horrida]
MGRPPGAKSYKIKELALLFRYVERHKPRGANHWTKVARDYNARVVKIGGAERKWENLKKKFDDLVRVQKPTGDPDCPPEVRTAKRLNSAILGAAVVGTTEDDSGGEATNTEEERDDVGAGMISDKSDEDDDFSVSDTDEEEAVPPATTAEGTSHSSTDEADPQNLSATSAAASGGKRGRESGSSAAPTPKKTNKGKAVDPGFTTGTQRQMFGAFTSLAEELKKSDTSADHGLCAQQLAQTALQLSSLSGQVTALTSQVAQLERQVLQMQFHASGSGTCSFNLSHFTPSADVPGSSNSSTFIDQTQT